MERSTIVVGAIEFATLSLGRGPLALCLHGFPDTAHTWRHLLPALAEAGYRAVAPFMRGYSPTATAPDGVYQVGALADDANRLHEALGGDADSVIVGHDWGALSAYGAAGCEPERWRRVVGLAVPPGPVMAGAFLGNLDQLQRSWYMFLFQHPVADLVVPANDFALVARLWHQWSPGYDAGVDIANVRESLAAPENTLAALGYYRATLGDGPRDPRFDSAQAASTAVPPQPTLYLHGRDDGCVGAELVADADAFYPTHVVTEIVDSAGHFLHLERPQLVNDRIVAFCS
jgi:pimeloyl-ACP methyl ester carboxylesterase